MATDNRNDEFATIRLDEEDRQAYQQKKQTGGYSKAPHNGPYNQTTAKTKKSGNGFWIFFIALIAFSGLGGCYYLFTQLQIQLQEAEFANKRIASLENKLSATGEEMGESTVALQVKVTDLSNKSEELWEQMDKLWASAWRRNQKEIAELADRLKSMDRQNKESISNLTSSSDSSKNQLTRTNRRLESIADEILALNVALEQAAADKIKLERDNKNLTDLVSLLEQRNLSLSTRLADLEIEVKTLSTSLSAQPSNSPTGPQ